MVSKACARKHALIPHSSLSILWTNLPFSFHIMCNLWCYGVCYDYASCYDNGFGYVTTCLSVCNLNQLHVVLSHAPNSNESVVLHSNDIVDPN